MTQVIVCEDRHGSLLVKSMDGNQDHLVQDSQDVQATLEYTNITRQEMTELRAGWDVVVEIYDSLIEAFNWS